MSLFEYIQSLDVETPLDLFSITNDQVPGFSAIHFCNAGAVSFRSIQYLAIACKTAWMPKDGESTVTTKLSVSDATGAVGNVILTYGLLGAKVTTVRTWTPFLDNYPTSDPSAYRAFVMRINQYSGSFGKEFEFDCVPAETLEQKGGRRYLRRCMWLLGDENCQAPDNLSFDLNGNTAAYANRTCRKDLSQCIQYHGHTKRFGGFPGVQYRR